MPISGHEVPMKMPAEVSEKVSDRKETITTDEVMHREFRRRDGSKRCSHWPL